MLEFFLKIIVPLSVIGPILVWIFNRHGLSKASKVLFYYLLLAGFGDIYSSTTSFLGINNLLGLHVYTLGEFLLLSWYFTTLLARNPIIGTIKIMAIIFALLCVINFAFFQGVYQFNTYTRSLGAFLTIVYCFNYFNQESKVFQTMPWQKKGANWIVTGLLIYFSGAFFLFLFSNILSTKIKRETWVNLWYGHGFLVVLMYVLISIGFINERRSR